MKVKDAFEKINQLKMDKIWYQCIIKSNPYHVDFTDIKAAIKRLDKEIDRLEELVYNMELDDSYEEKL